MSRDDIFTFDVLRVQQPIGDFYLAALPARTLVEISYADVRRLAEEQRDVERYLGIQRPISSRRIKQIKKYIPENIKLLEQGRIVSEKLVGYLKKHSELNKRISRNGNIVFETTEHAMKSALFLGQSVRAETIHL